MSFYLLRKQWGSRYPLWPLDLRPLPHCLRSGCLPRSLVHISLEVGHFPKPSMKESPNARLGLEIKPTSPAETNGPDGRHSPLEPLLGPSRAPSYFSQPERPATMRLLSPLSRRHLELETSYPLIKHHKLNDWSKSNHHHHVILFVTFYHKFWSIQNKSIYNLTRSSKVLYDSKRNLLNR